VADRAVVHAPAPVAELEYVTHPITEIVFTVVYYLINGTLQMAQFVLE